MRSDLIDCARTAPVLRGEVGASWVTPPPTVASVLLTGARVPVDAIDLSGLVIGSLSALARLAPLFDVWMVEIARSLRLGPQTLARPAAGRSGTRDDAT